MSKAKRKTNFNNPWKETCTWISVVRGDEFSANCNICNKKFLIHGGISDIRQHSKTEACQESRVDERTERIYE